MTFNSLLLDLCRPISVKEREQDGAAEAHSRSYHSRQRFPRCRETIDKGGWISHVLCDGSGAYWDGFTAIDSEGRSVNGLSDSCRKEMIHVILDGVFGEAARDAYLDQTHYWQIRDELISWPDQRAIHAKSLRAMELRRISNAESLDPNVVPA